MIFFRLPSAVVWNVSPEIVNFDVWGVTLSITWYGLLFASGFIIGQQVLFRIFRQDGKPAADVDMLTVYVGIATVLGARLGHFVFYEWELLLSNPIRWLKILVTPPFMGLASHGSTVAIWLGLYLYARRKPDQDFLWVVDRVVIPGSFVAALIRLGNLFNSEIYGKPTHLPWGFLFVRETDPGLLPVLPRHPTQLYEAFFYFFLFALTFALWKYKRHQLPQGFITGIFLILLFGFRFVIEFFKTNQAGFENDLRLNMGQLLSIPAILTGVMILLTAKHNRAVPRSL